jgi:hypothetical protein
VSDPKEVACVVCGLKSHRSDWQNVKAPQCESHTVGAKPPAPAAAPPVVAEAKPPSVSK